MDVHTAYHPPLALTIISSISIGVGALAATWIAFDILWRKGWRSMMWIMIPVYIINALYLWPITLWSYLKYGRPEKPSRKQDHKQEGQHTEHHVHGGHQITTSDPEAGHQDVDVHSHHDRQTEVPDQAQHAEPGPEHDHNHNSEQMEVPKEGRPGEVVGGHNCHGGGDMPMFANVTIAVTHCGAGCVLGDIIGEWIVYGSGATISGRDLWPCWIIDFVLALAFGIFFQYFSIAPMTGEYGPKTLWRAATADIFSLVAFEVGLFGWMAIFVITIFRWRLEMNTVTYWWMMQIGMFCGHWTAVPVNWWLLNANIKVSIH